MRKGTKKGFTLVELLVVIGIIALLISILLPALSKARDQANNVVCMSSERQFYNVWQMYAADYRGFAIPCRFQEVGASNEYYDPIIIGQEMGKASGHYDTSTGAGGSGADRAKDSAAVIKFLFKCPAANHAGDPTQTDVMAAAKSVYFGDYIYNTWMGYIDLNNLPGDPVKNPFLKVVQIPANVIILMESRKPNVMISGSQFIPLTGLGGNDYKDYFQKDTEIWLTDPKSGSGKPTPQNLSELRIGTPHQKNTKMNVLSADGHISTVDPYKDFFANKNDMTTVKDYLWNSGDNYPGITTHPNWRKGAPGI